MSKLSTLTSRGRFLGAAAALLLTTAVSAVAPTLAGAEQVTERSLRVSSSAAGDVVVGLPGSATNGQKATYAFSFKAATAGSLQSMSFMFCTSAFGYLDGNGDPRNINSNACASPAGFDATNAPTATVETGASSEFWTTTAPTTPANNVIKIGALGPKYGTDLVASFSNYGTQDVDVFGPGVQIYATIPDNQYKFLQGTSMASPNVAGVAALIRSYYPSLTAPQVKQILMDSGIPTNIEVVLGGDKGNKRPFTKASKSGKMVNAYNALIMAENMAKKK